MAMTSDRRPRNSPWPNRFTRGIVRVRGIDGGYERGPMDKAKARRLLEARKDVLLQLVRAATEQGSLDEEQRSSAGEMTALEPGDIGTDTHERELGYSVRESAEASLRDVERALERVDQGIYGICPVCGEPIDDARLEAKPEAEFCVKHQPSAA